MPTPVKVTGFEYGALTLSTNGAGLCDVLNGSVCTVQSSVKRTGSYALRIAASASGAQNIGWNVASPNTAVVRFYVYLATLPSANVVLAFVNSAAGGVLNFRYDNVSGKFQCGFSTGSAQTGTATVVAETWYRIELRITVNTNPRTCDWYVNTTAETQATASETGSTVSRISLGTNASATYNAYYDDLVISTTSGDFPIGPGGTQGLQSDADGSHNNLGGVLQDAGGNDIGVGYPAYDDLNSIPISEATTYIKCNNAGGSNYVEVTFANISDTHSSIIGVSAVLAYTSAATQGNNGGCIISKDAFSSYTEIWGNPTTRQDYSDGSTTNPYYKSVIVSGANDDTTVNALTVRLGYSSDATPDPYWLNLIAEVAYAVTEGTTYPKSVDGTVTSSGALARETKAVKVGTVNSTGVVTKDVSTSRVFGTISSVGALLRQVATSLTGGVSSTGTMNASRLLSIILEGVISSSGSIAFEILKALTGSIGSTGDVSRHTSTSLTGTVSSAGILSSLRTSFLSLEGTIVSAGVLTKQSFVYFTGTINSGGIVSSLRTAYAVLSGSIDSVGELHKEVLTFLAGTISSSGTINAVRMFLRDISGVVSSSGDLIRLVDTNLQATVTSSGTLLKAIYISLSGSISSSGTVESLKAFLLTLTGSIASSGSLTYLIYKDLQATISSSGILTRQAYKSFTASVTSSGSLTKQSFVYLMGSVSSTGVLGTAKTILRALTGNVTSTGSLEKTTFKELIGIVTSTGIAEGVIAGIIYYMALEGTISSTGELLKLVGRSFAGVVYSTGSLIKSVYKFLVGVVTAIGILEVPREPHETLEFELRVGTLLSFEQVIQDSTSFESIHRSELSFTLEF